MKIRDFGVEMWMNAYETWATCNLAETCVESLTVKQLLELTGAGDKAIQDILAMKLTYGAIDGSQRLREAISSLYKTVPPERISVMHGAIGANALTLTGIIEPGDHVVTVVPTYQQHYSIPESIGAKVSLCRLKEELGWQPDLDELRRLAAPGTKMICINNPNNPTGALIDEDTLSAIVEIARACGAWLLCDEAYRGLSHEGDPFSPSVADLYEKGISTGTMSKPFSLAGLRVGWVAAPAEVIEMLAHMRDYHVISVGMIDDYLAALALENKEKILARSLSICREHLAILDDWVAREPHIHYTKPKAGTVTLLHYDLDMPSPVLCRRLQEDTGVMLLPGSCFDMEKCLRIGFANNRQDLERGLSIFSQWLAAL
ncbi:MAG TPA: aminotransferase [Candidatus Acidoferrum sp.]|nr:aminotransferase [Candidatus Acidoferrum sp.]